MDITSRNKTKNELLINWSKWLISINGLAATGCIVGLKTAGQATEKVGLYFFVAIFSFGLSMICATLFVFLLSAQSITSAEKATSPFNFLAWIQLTLFIIGLIFVLIWIGFLSKVF